MVEELQQAHGVAGAAADVEGVARRVVDAGERRPVDRHHVAHVQDVAHLPSVAVERDRLAGERPDQEVGDPALVLVAHLARTVDAAHPHHRRRDAEAAGVVEDVLVRRSLGAAVGRVEVEGPGLADAAPAQVRIGRQIGVADRLQGDVGQVAVDLVGRGVEERHRPRLRPQGLQQVHGAEEVDLHVGPRRGEARRHRHLGGEVEHRAGLRHRAAELLDVADVGDDRDDPGAVALPQPREVGLDAGAREDVVDDHRVAVGREAVGQVGTDEPGAPGDEDRPAAHATRPRASSSRRASATRSTACCSATQAASSASPSAKSRRGA